MAPDDSAKNSTSSGLPVTVVKNVGAYRQEIKIEILSCNGENYTGTITMQEAKHGIYRDCLGFKDFANFDGVRFSYKGVRIVAFKLKNAIDVDQQLIGSQFFDYKRKVRKNGILSDLILFITKTMLCDYIYS